MFLIKLLLCMDEISLLIMDLEILVSQEQRCLLKLEASLRP